MTSNSEAVATDILGRRGLSLSEAGKFAVLGYLDRNLRVRHGEASKPIVTVATEAGREITPYEFFDDWLAQNPGYFAGIKAAASSMPNEPGTMTQRMIASIASRKANAKEQVAEIAKAGNPWSKSSWSLTNQMRVTNLNPELAGQLKQEARP